MLRQLNGDECAKLYYVKSDGKDKKICKAVNEKEKQAKQIESLIYFLS